MSTITLKTKKVDFRNETKTASPHSFYEYQGNIARSSTGQPSIGPLSAIHDVNSRPYLDPVLVLQSLRKLTQGFHFQSKNLNWWPN